MSNFPPENETHAEWLKRQAAAPQPAPATPQPIIVNVTNNERPRKKMHHGLHLLLTILTGGAWGVVWLILAIAHRGD